jgi:hypothetical protein
MFKYGKGSERNMALMFSFLKALQREGSPFNTSIEINYLSRDMLIIAYDGRYSDYGRSTKAFLEEYYHPKGGK